MSIAYMPADAAVAINDMLDNCAVVKPGQNVLILAALDGLHGGRNLVDEQTIAWIQSAVQARGAHPAVLWVDMPSRPKVIWPDIPTPETAWKIPPIVKAAMRGADLLINHISDLSSEEHLKEFPELLKELKLPMVRNMATTTGLLMSDWARTPHDLIAEIRYRMAELIMPDETWSLTHPNGTHLEGKVGSPGRGGEGYAYWRHDGYYRPFPDGIYPAVNPVGTRGLYRVRSDDAGLGERYRRAVPFLCAGAHLGREQSDDEVRGRRGGDSHRGFLEALARRVGEKNAFEIRGPHGGVHPHAIVSPAQCPDEDYREFVASFHTGAVHMHLGQAARVLRFRSICTRRRKRAARRSRSAATCCMTTGGSGSPTIPGEGGGGALRRTTGHSIKVTSLVISDLRRCRLCSESGRG